MIRHFSNEVCCFEIWIEGTSSENFSIILHLCNFVIDFFLLYWFLLFTRFGFVIGRPLDFASYSVGIGRLFSTQCFLFLYRISFSSDSLLMFSKWDVRITVVISVWMKWATVQFFWGNNKTEAHQNTHQTNLDKFERNHWKNR